MLECMDTFQILVPPWEIGKKAQLFGNNKVLLCFHHEIDEIDFPELTR